MNNLYHEYSHDLTKNIVIEVKLIYNSCSVFKGGYRNGFYNITESYD